MRILFPLAALTLTIATFGATLAVPAYAETVSTTVHYSDLNLASPAGVATLEGRVSRAIRKICKAMPTSNLEQRAMWKSCVTEARRSATPQMTAAINSARGEAYAEAGIKFASNR